MKLSVRALAVVCAEYAGGHQVCQRSLGGLWRSLDYITQHHNRQLVLGFGHLLNYVWCVLCVFQSVGALLFVGFGTTNRNSQDLRLGGSLC